MMNIFVEKLARTNGERVSLSWDLIKSSEKTALVIASLDNSGEPIAIMGDVIHIGDKKYLVEKDLSVTLIDTDEYLYYKGIPLSERISRWFADDIEQKNKEYNILN